MTVTPKLLNRLIGAVVLIILGVTILPDVFDGEKEHHKENGNAISLIDLPEQKLEKVKLKEPESIDDVKLPQPVVEDIKAEEAKISAGFADAAWIIRLGTFRNHENANSLVEKLRAKGYTAQVKPKNLRPGDLARVEVGPEISKEKIETMQQELTKITGLKGQVIKFNPVIL